MNADEREALASAILRRDRECREVFGRSPFAAGYVDALVPVVDQIAEARVRAALNKAADMSGWICVEAEKHRPDVIRGGCTCGFCAWSPEHVALMAHRDGMHAHMASIVRAAAERPPP